MISSPRRWLVALLALAVLACGPTGTEPAAIATATPDPAALYRDFADCEPLPTASPQGGDPADVVGLVTLPDAWIESITRTGPLVSVRGLVSQTPLELRDTFAGRDDVEVVYIEDEGYEVEILLDQGDTRTFFKATIRCRTGSVFAQIVGPDGEADLLPVPGGQSTG